MNETSIEWTDCRWNPVRGCSMARGSELGACLNCYAAAMASRNLPGMRSPTTGEPFARKTASGPRWTGAVELIPSKLDEPLRWRKPQRVFVNSMSDLFHEALPDEAIAAVFGIMAAAPQHTFQVLTKRPARMREWFRWIEQGFQGAGIGGTRLAPAGPSVRANRIPTGAWRALPWPLPNVWLGVSVEDQKTADERIPLLLQTPATVRFVSYEPALGPVDLAAGLMPVCGRCNGEMSVSVPGGGKACPECFDSPQGQGTVRGLDWVIVGGESGPGARPCDVAWIRSVVRQCREAAVPCFVKQAGSNVRTRNDSLSTEHDPDIQTDWPEPKDGWGRIDENLNGYRDGYQGAPIRIYLKHPKGGDPAEWPEDLRVREFPEPRG